MLCFSDMGGFILSLLCQVHLPPMLRISDMLDIVSAQYNNDHYQMVSVFYDVRIYIYKPITIVPFTQ